MDDWKVLPYLSRDLCWGLGRRTLRGYEVKRLLFWFGVGPETEEEEESVGNITDVTSRSPKLLKARNDKHNLRMLRLKHSTDGSVHFPASSSPGFGCSLLQRGVRGGYRGDLLRVSQQGRV